jgi:hypothetical protein
MLLTHIRMSQAYEIWSLMLQKIKELAWLRRFRRVAMGNNATIAKTQHSETNGHE